MLFCRAKRYCGKQIGPYRVIKPIGAGRYGVCFLAELDGTPIILKRLKAPQRLGTDRKAMNEAVILGTLNHHGIPKLIGTVHEKDFSGVALEYMSGETVEALLFQRKHRFTGAEIYAVGEQLIDIIRHLHRKEIVHGDIRIPNVLVHEGRVALVDFGLARREDMGRYRRDIDFSYLGDFLLYLLYSTFVKKNRKDLPWYKELTLTHVQRRFLKRLLKLEKPFEDIEDVAAEFRSAFGSGNTSSSSQSDRQVRPGS